MKHIKIYENFVNEEVQHEYNIKMIRKIAEDLSLRTEGDYVLLYHGTSKANMKKILKSGMYKSGTWFAADIETSKRYSLSKVSRASDAAVDTIFVYMGSLAYNEYFTSLEDLYLNSNGTIAPKTYMRISTRTDRR